MARCCARTCTGPPIAAATRCCSDGRSTARRPGPPGSPARTAGQGYVVCVNDMRGQFASEGEFDPFRYDVEDSYDVVEWCAAQPWSNGKVGMFGSSSCGFVQLLAAIAQPPHLV